MVLVWQRSIGRAITKMLDALAFEWEEVMPVAWRRGTRRQDKWSPDLSG